MKNILLVLSLVFISHSVFGQVCGLHVIKYVGELKINTKIEVKRIVLPSITNLIGREENDEFMFVEADLTNNKFECISVEMSCSVLINAKSFYKRYDDVIEYVEIVVKISEEGVDEETVIKIPWAKIEMRNGKDEEVGRCFIIDLGEIEL